MVWRDYFEFDREVDEFKAKCRLCRERFTYVSMSNGKKTTSTSGGEAHLMSAQHKFSKDFIAYFKNLVDKTSNSTGSMDKSVKYTAPPLKILLDALLCVVGLAGLGRNKNINWRIHNESQNCKNFKQR